MYKYDLYISYNFHEASKNWIAGFIDKLKFYLLQELGDDPSIFFDFGQINSGANWNEELRNSLKCSKCLLCFWSPVYFRSEYGLSEWQSFEERELFTKFNPLIFPVILMKGGDYLPEQARIRQALDASNYFTTFKGFWASNETMKLEMLIQNLAKDIVVSINKVPEYSEAFPLVGILGYNTQSLKDRYAMPPPLTKLIL